MLLQAEFCLQEDLHVVRGLAISAEGFDFSAGADFVVGGAALWGWVQLGQCEGGHIIY